jgi:hypothetical protein
MTPEQQQRAQEALQRAMQHSTMLSPEQVQAIQNAMAHLQQGGAGGFNFTETGQKAPCFQAGDEWPLLLY